MPRPPLVDLFRHNSWATIRLIEFAKTLTPEQRAWTVPGTFGPIDQTLVHIVGGDRWYLLLLTGERPQDPPQRAGGPIDLDRLLEQARTVAERYERYAAGSIDPDEVRTTETTSSSGEKQVDRDTVGTILAQVMHHGNEHRSQIGTALSAHGVEHPDYAGWAWGNEVIRP